jgi:hypothetical protein
MHCPVSGVMDVQAAEQFAAVDSPQQLHSDAALAGAIIAVAMATATHKARIMKHPSVLVEF